MNKHLPKHTRKISKLAKLIFGTAAVATTAAAATFALYICHPKEYPEITDMINHTISHGDTYWNIARKMKEKNPCLNKFDIPELVYEIRKINPKYDPGNLKPGNNLLIPDYSSSC